MTEEHPPSPPYPLPPTPQFYNTTTDPSSHIPYPLPPARLYPTHTMDHPPDTPMADAAVRIARISTPKNPPPKLRILKPKPQPSPATYPTYPNPAHTHTTTTATTPRTATPVRNTNGTATATATATIMAEVSPIPAKTAAHGAPVRRYLNEKVTGVVLEGMKRLAAEQPDDPLRVLGEYLLQRSRELEGT